MKIILLLLLFFSPLFSYAQEPPRFEVKGVVSYYFNANYGDKPDTGAKAYVLTEEDLKLLGSSSNQLYDYKLAYYKLGVDPISLQIAIDGAKSEKAKKSLNERLGPKIALLDKLKQVNDSVVTVMAKLESSQWQTKRVTADGNGVFVKKVKPGDYFVLVISAHRTGRTSAEITGLYTLKSVAVKDDDVEVPIRFGVE